MDRIEKVGKTAEEAILEALMELKVSRDDVEITILEPGSRGILGFGAKPARVLLVKKFDPGKKATSFIREISAAMGVAVEVETQLTEKGLNINLSGEDMGFFIGKRGQTLDSLQYLISLVVNKGDAQYLSINLDTENYRKRRRETLENLAINLAKKAKQTRKNIVLEPMTPNERRIIHSVLQNDKFVDTHSEGDEPYRNVVITLKKQARQGAAPSSAQSQGNKGYKQNWEKKDYKRDKQETVTTATAPHVEE